MTVSDHVIARCEWQTRFDQEAHAVALQNALSQWSHQVMPGILCRFFDAHCPTTDNWRIERLEVDLGSVPLLSLDDTLTQRLVAALEEALGRAFLQQQVRCLPVRISDAPAKDADTTARETLRWFLRHGTLPWWSRERTSLLSLVDRLLNQQPQHLASLVRHVGQETAARQRIAWQWGDNRLCRTVTLLEPWHARFICRYADQVRDSQRRYALVRQQDSRFGTHLWYWILTHLLVDRGTLFNTQQFVYSTLWQMAQHYQLDFQTLVAELSRAVSRLQRDGAVAPSFLQVLVRLQQDGAGLSVPETPDDSGLWGTLQRLLHRREAIVQQGRESVHISELLMRLAWQDQTRAAALLRQEGRSADVREHLLRHLNQVQLAQVVAVLAPQDHRFIMLHVTRTQLSLRQQRRPSWLIWEVLLAWLLVNPGSHFSRRQFVQQTLLTLSQRTRIDYVLLLTMLTQASVQQLQAGHFELLTILHELQKQHLKAHQRDDSLWLPLAIYLREGTPVRSTHHQGGMFHVVSGRAGLRAVLLMPSASDRLRSELRQLRQTHGDTHQLSQRLVAALAGNGGVTLSDLQRLMTALSATLCAPAMALLTSLQVWQRQERWLAGVTRQLAEAMVEAMLCDLDGPQNARRWLHRLLSILSRRTAVPAVRIVAEWRDNAHTDKTFGQLDADLAPLLLHYSVSRRRASALPGLPRVSASEQRKTNSLPTGDDTSTGSVVIPVIRPDSLLNHPQAGRLLEALSRTPQGQQWLAETLPAVWRTREQREQLWRELLSVTRQALSRSVGAEPVVDTFLLFRLRQLFWLQLSQTWRAYWLAHRTLVGSLTDVTDFIARLLLRWCRQQPVYPQQMTTVLQQRLTAPAGAQAVALWRSWLRVAGVQTAGNDTPNDNQLVTLSQVIASDATALSEEPTTAASQESGQSDASTSDSSCWPWPGTDKALATWLTHGTLPASASEVDSIPCNEQTWLMMLLLHAPRHFAQCVRPLYARPAVKARLLNHLPVSAVVDALAQSGLSVTVSIQTVQALRALLARLALPSVNQAVRQQSLLSCLLDAWLLPGYGQMDTDALVRQLFWRLLRDGGCSRIQLQRALGAPGLSVGHGLRHALDALIGILARGDASERALSRLRPVEPVRHDVAPQAMPLIVGNAGVVLLQSYIRPLFERLRLVSDNAFVSAGAQRAAVHYLQYLITGQSHSEEHELVLNKLLCGLPLSHPLDAGIEISSDEIATIHSLIEAIAQYWSAIGKTSVEGFRGNWLVRDGALTEKSEYWELVVTRRSYDILIGRSALSYTIIRLPWMSKPIYVTWPV
ncbi:contractile injection system tape measure protein [Dickeya oryzae]|uniref:contractile injection system tape measure protein n=1 Tax=Dickeya oryzae TaxID=1240404 RepID=UPI0012968DF7|nr:contractile injection system tape measure protein [Dickeya oryzae]